jgi:hypothetical protein
MAGCPAGSGCPRTVRACRSWDLHAPAQSAPAPRRRTRTGPRDTRSTAADPSTAPGRTNRCREQPNTIANAHTVTSRSVRGSAIAAMSATGSSGCDTRGSSCIGASVDGRLPDPLRRGRLLRLRACAARGREPSASSNAPPLTRSSDSSVRGRSVDRGAHAPARKGTPAPSRRTPTRQHRYGRPSTAGVWIAAALLGSATPGMRAVDEMVSRDYTHSSAGPSHPRRDRRHVSASVPVEAGGAATVIPVLTC